MTSDISAKISGSQNSTSDDTIRLFSAYDAVCYAEEQLDDIERNIENAIPKKIDICKLQEILIILDKIQESILDVKNAMAESVTKFLSNATKKVTTGSDNQTDNKSNGNKEDKDKDSKSHISVDERYTKYLTTQIVLKKFQILRYRMDLVKIEIDIKAARLKKHSLIESLNGKGSATDPTNAAMASTVSSAATTANSILTVIDTIVTAINNSTVMNVNGAGMAFFPTPKSISKVDINIANSNQSTTNNIPDAIDQLISNAENKIREINGKAKKAKILSMGAAGAKSATSGKFNPGSFGDIPKFDPSVIRDSVRMLLQLVTDADALPRYEMLSVSNIRFLTFLVTGFEPAGKMTFGIPGYP